MKRALILAALIAASFVVGRSAGIRHAMNDSIIWTVERYDPDHPEDTARPDGTDLTVFIDLDGNTYEHGAFLG